MSDAAFNGLIDEYLTGEIRMVAHRVAAKVPHEFFEAPASSSGRYHPDWARGRGGLVRHTMAVAWWVSQLAELYEVSRDDEQAALFAAIFHDGWKGWASDRWTDHTVADHGRTAANVIREAVKDEPSHRSALLARACDAIEKHMAQWSFEPAHFSGLPVVTQLVATADYCASRRVPSYEGSSDAM